MSVPYQPVLHLINITGDSWLTSIELVDYLKKSGLTYVGTLRKNKEEIPPQFQPSNTRRLGNTI